MKIVIQAMWLMNRNKRRPSWWPNSFKNLTEAQKSYLYQPLLSSVDDSSHMLCNVPLCALKIQIYCMFLFIFSIPVSTIWTSEIYVWTSRILGLVVHGQVKFSQVSQALESTWKCKKNTPTQIKCIVKFVTFLLHRLIFYQSWFKEPLFCMD